MHQNQDHAGFFPFMGENFVENSDREIRILGGTAC
jgi:hypothetical protein